MSEEDILGAPVQNEGVVSEALRRQLEPVATDDPADWQEGQVFRGRLAGAQAEKTYRLGRQLGGGLTSLVWEAFEPGDDTNPERAVALKVLRPDPSIMLIDAFYTEIEVLLRMATEAQPAYPFPLAAPELYGYSPRGSKPMFLSMELVPGRPAADLIGRRSGLPQSAQEILFTAEPFVQKLERFQLEAYAEPGLPEGVLEAVKEAKRLGEQTAAQLEAARDGLAALEERQERLSEAEIVVIGAQAARVFYALHTVLQRSYLDFQLKNVFFERESGRVKVIDWNVVTKSGDVRVAEDVFKLANGLFYLLTQVLLGAPATESVLDEKGDRAWLEASPLLRVVLQRALLANSPRPYSAVHEWPLSEGLRLLNEVESLGGALEMIQRCEQAEVDKLLDLARRAQDAGFSNEALGFLQAARRNLEHEDDDDLRAALAEKLSQAEQRLLQDLRSLAELHNQARSWLDANDRAHARQAVERALQIAPQNLETHRWLALLEGVGEQSIDEFYRAWLGGLSAGMRSLSDRKWRRAGQHFQTAPQRIASLLADAELNRRMEELETYFQAYERSSDQIAGERFVKALDAAEESIREKQPPYYLLVLQTWPDLDDLRSRSESQREKAGRLAAAVSESGVIVDAQGEYEFSEVLHKFRQHLGDFPGETGLLRIALEAGQRALSKSDPDRATAVLFAGLENVRGSAYYYSLRRLARLAQDWHAARRCAGTGKWDIACEALRRNLEAAQEYFVPLTREINSWFEQALQSNDSTGRRALMDLERDLNSDATAAGNKYQQKYNQHLDYSLKYVDEKLARMGGGDEYG